MTVSNKQFDLICRPKLSQSSKYYKQIYTCNISALCLSLLSLPYAFIFGCFFSVKLSGLVIIIVSFYLLTIVLNRYSFFDIARYNFCFSISVGIFIFELILPNIGIQTLYIVSAAFPILFFDRSELKKKIALVIIFVIFFIILNYIHYIMRFSYYTPSKAQVIALYVSITVVVISINCYIINHFSTSYLNTLDVVLDKNKALQISYAELKESKKRENEAHDEALFGKVIRGIAHEIKNPLAGLDLWANLLAKDLDNPETVKKASDVFQKNISRLIQRTHIMLKYTGDQKYVVKQFDLNTVLSDVGLLFEHNFKKKMIAFKLKKTPKLTVYGSEDLLHSAVRNILLNAMQFTPKEGRIKISVSKKEYLDPDNNNRMGAEIAISDNGIGIPKDQITEIFKPFITSHAQSQNAGLGLAEVQKSMAYMYGNVSVSSEEGAGTTFYLYVPLKEPISDDGKPLIKPITTDNI